MAYGISYKNLFYCRKRAIERRHHFVHGLTYEENNRKSSLKRDAVRAWLTQYSDDMGQLQPNKQETHLQEGLTLEELRGEYLEDQADNDASKKISLSHWYKCVDEDFSDWLKIPKSIRFSQCDVCASNKLLKEGLSKSQKKQQKTFSFCNCLTHGVVELVLICVVIVFQRNTKARWISIWSLPEPSEQSFTSTVVKPI